MAEKGDMSNLVVGFVVRMRKRVVSAQGEANPRSEVLGGKRWKKSGSGGEVQKSQAIVTLDSPKRASKAIWLCRVFLKKLSRKPTRRWKIVSQPRGPSDVARVVREAPLEIAIGPSFSVKLENVSPQRASLPD